MSKQEGLMPIDMHTPEGRWNVLCCSVLSAVGIGGLLIVIQAIQDLAK